MKMEIHHQNKANPATSEMKLVLLIMERRAGERRPRRKESRLTERPV
jgi:hypothetical protein